MQGTTSDLQFLIGLNLSIIFIGGALRHFIIYKNLPSGATPTLGQDLYRVCYFCYSKEVSDTVAIQKCQHYYLQVPRRSFCCSLLQMACQARRIHHWNGDSPWQSQVCEPHCH